MKYREEIAKAYAFLKARGLFDEYVASQGAIDTEGWGRPED
jgi:hypothetical protein